MAGNGPVKHRDKLPVSRIRTIMKSSPEVENIGQQSLYLVTKAAEMFIHFLTEEAYKECKGHKEIEYKNVAEVVQTNDVLAFLREIMPRKITFKQYKELMAKKNTPVPTCDPEDSSDGDDGEEDNDVNDDN